MSQALYRIWRPVLWEEVVGQDHIVQTLKNAIALNRVGHAYLFAGPKGTGKTTSARLLAKAVNCLEEDLSKRPCNHCANCVAVNEGRFLDLIEIDAASNTSVDDVRELREKINFAPSQGRFKVYIIDEVHMLSTSAFNALLKTLEEPPAHVIFILATTEIHKIPATVLSRCQRHEFRRIPVPIIVEKIKTLCVREEIQIQEDALSLIARQATGSLRDAISLVDQLASISKEITLPVAQDVLGTATNQSVIGLMDACLAQDSAKGLGIIQTALDSGADARQYARQVVDYLRDLLVIKLKAGNSLELTPEVRKVMQKQSDQFDSHQLIEMINSFSSAATDLKANWHPGLGLELAYANTVSWQPTEVNPAQTSSKSSKKTSPDQKTAEQSPKKQTAPVKVKDPDPSPAREAAPPPTGPLSLDLVHFHWDAIKKATRSENPVTGAVLNSARLIQAENGTITLNFSSELLRDRMAEEKNRRIVTKVISGILGQEIKIIPTVGQTSSDEETPEGIIPNGLVDFALRELQGRIRKIEDQPKEEE